MSAAAVIALRRKRLIRAFRDAGATDRDRAVTLEQVGQRRSWVFGQMARYGVFIATEDGRYFMNEQVADKFQAACRNRALIFGGVVLLVFIVTWLSGWLKR